MWPKNVGMLFSKSKKTIEDPDVIVAGEKSQLAQKYKYLGIYLDSYLNLRTNVKRFN